MADSNLNEPVTIQATRLDTSILPRNIFSQSYLLYVINQGADVGAIAGKANQAGQGAYDAQVKNDEQDVELADHDARISANTKAINLLEVRLTTAEGKIVVLRSDVDYLLDEVIDIQAHLVTVDQRLDDVENDVSGIKSDYVSKTVLQGCFSRKSRLSGRKNFSRRTLMLMRLVIAVLCVSWLLNIQTRLNPFVKAWDSLMKTSAILSAP